MRISVIIPSRNEGDVVVEVASAARACCDEAIVVDGHSTDGSPERLRAAGLAVIEDRGFGKGDAIRLGLEAASGDILVTMDADGSHDPAEIRSLVAPIVSGEADMVIGCRMRGGSDEFAHHFGDAWRRAWTMMTASANRPRFAYA